MEPERLIIGEAVEVELPTARLGTRILSVSIDLLAQLVLYFGLAIALTPLTGRISPAAEAALGILVVVFVFIVWPVTFETVTRGRSPGKYALGLRVVRDDGGPIRFRHALVRGLIGAAIEWPGLLMPFVAWIVGATTLLFSPRSKRIGDLAAGTIVLAERQPDLSAATVGMPPRLAGWARTLDLTRVDDELAMAIRQFITRAPVLRRESRLPLGLRLLDEVRKVTMPPPPPGTTAWEFLNAVLAERGRRESERLAARRAVVALGAPPLPTRS